MKISNIGNARQSDQAKRKKGADGKGGEFAERLKEAVAGTETGAAVDTPSVGAADSLLAVQEVPDASHGRSKGLVKRYGDDVLDRLEEIRIGILSGSISKDKLSGLAQAMRQRRQKSDDPRLNEIIDEIELRAEVEIAKLTRTV